LTKAITGRKRRGNDVHPRPQSHLGHKAIGRRAYCGLIKVVLGIGQLGRQARDRRVDTVDVRGIGEARPFLLGLGADPRLFRGFEIAGGVIERRLGDDFLFEQLLLAVVGLLRQHELRVGPLGGRCHLVERSLKRFLLRALASERFSKHLQLGHE
jgi:hypothetical protein